MLAFSIDDHIYKTISSVWSVATSVSVESVIVWFKPGVLWQLVHSVIGKLEHFEASQVEWSICAAVSEATDVVAAVEQALFGHIDMNILLMKGHFCQLGCAFTNGHSSPFIFISLEQQPSSHPHWQLSQFLLEHWQVAVLASLDCWVIFNKWFLLG